MASSKDHPEDAVAYFIVGDKLALVTTDGSTDNSIHFCPKKGFGQRPGHVRNSTECSFLKISRKKMSFAGRRNCTSLCSLVKHVPE